LPALTERQIASRLIPFAAIPVIELTSIGWAETI
jgi:hypothetical protein